MNFHQRINAVLHHKKPDKVPFAPSENLIPRGDFEREVRNRGMGIYARRAIYWSETPNVRTETKRELDTYLTIYHTPAGILSAGRKGSVTKWMIEDTQDYEAAISIVNDTVFHADYSVYSNTVRDLGEDGIVRAVGLEHPLQAAIKYIGPSNLEKERQLRSWWFDRLLKALEDMTERLFPIIRSAPAEFISIGEINDTLSPELFKEYVLPFYQKFLPRLHEKVKVKHDASLSKVGHAASLSYTPKICSLEFTSSRISMLKDLIEQTGADVIEGFTPSSESDMSLMEALNGMTVWVDFPEEVIYDSVEKVKEYTTNLLKSDKTGKLLVIGLNTIKIPTDEEKENTLKNSVVAILDAINHIALRISVK